MSRVEFTIIRRQFLGHPVRTALTILGIGVTLSIAIAVIGLSRGMTGTITAGIEEPGADLLITPRDSFTLIGSSVPPGLADVAAATPGVSGASAALLHFAGLDGKLNAVAWGWPAGSFLWARVALTAGRLPRVEETDVVVLGERTLRALGKSIGDTVEIEVQPFTIVGVARYGSLLNQEVALAPLPGLQRALGRSGSASFIQVRLERPIDAARAQATRARLVERVGGYLVADTSEYVQNIRMVRVIGAVADAIVWLMMGLVVLIVANMQLMAVNARAYDFAVLSAIGWSARRILALVLKESGALALLGLATGLLLGALLIRLATAALADVAEIDARLSLVQILTIACATMISAFVGAMLPGWQALRTPVAAILRRG